MLSTAGWPPSFPLPCFSQLCSPQEQGSSCFCFSRDGDHGTWDERLLVPEAGLLLEEGASRNTPPTWTSAGTPGQYLGEGELPQHPLILARQLPAELLVFRESWHRSRGSPRLAPPSRSPPGTTSEEVARLTPARSGEETPHFKERQQGMIFCFSE